MSVQVVFTCPFDELQGSMFIWLADLLVLVELDNLAVLRIARGLCMFG